MPKPVITIVHDEYTIAPYAICPICGANVVFKTTKISIDEDRVHVSEIEFTCYADDAHANYALDGVSENAEKWDFQTQRIMDWLQTDGVQILIDVK